MENLAKAYGPKGRGYSLYSFGVFCFPQFREERNIEPILADMDRVIIMKRVNAPTKGIVYTYNTKDGGAIRDAITRYFVEYL